MGAPATSGCNESPNRPDCRNEHCTKCRADDKPRAKKSLMQSIRVVNIEFRRTGRIGNERFSGGVTRWVEDRSKDPKREDYAESEIAYGVDNGE